MSEKKKEDKAKAKGKRGGHTHGNRWGDEFPTKTVRIPIYLEKRAIRVIQELHNAVREEKGLPPVPIIRDESDEEE